MFKLIQTIKNYIRSIFKSKEQKEEPSVPPISNLLLGTDFRNIPEIKRAKKAIDKVRKKQEANFDA